jgi:hypothetical protein
LARNDWTGVRIPVALAKKIDEYLKEREEAKVAGLFSRSELVTRIVAEWLVSGYGIDGGGLRKRDEMLYGVIERLESVSKKLEIGDAATPTTPSSRRPTVSLTADAEPHRVITAKLEHTIKEILDAPELSAMTRFRVVDLADTIHRWAIIEEETEKEPERTITEILEEKRKRREEQENAMIKMMEREAKRFQNMSQQQVEDALNKMQKEANIQPPHSPRFIKKLAETLRKGGYVDYAGRELYFNKAGQEEVEPTEQEQK